jgi:hypothetical protein
MHIFKCLPSLVSSENLILNGKSGKSGKEGPQSILRYYPVFTLQTKGNHKKTISIVGTQIEIQIIRFPNKKHAATSNVVVS